MITALQIAKSEALFLNDRIPSSRGLLRITAYWGDTALGYIEQGRIFDAGSAAKHSAHYGYLALRDQPPPPDRLAMRPAA
jgi:hypothetical protein